MHFHAVWKAGIRRQLSPYCGGGSKLCRMQVLTVVRLHVPLWGHHLPGCRELVAMAAAVAETSSYHSDGVRTLYLSLVMAS